MRTLIMLAWLWIPIAVQAQGRLEQVREETSGDKNSSSENNSSSDPNCNEASVAGAFLDVLTNSESDDSAPFLGRFNSFPYASEVTPYMWVDRPNGQSLSLRAGLEGGSNFDGINRAGLHLFLDSEPRIGLKSGWDLLSEKLARGGRDEMTIGDVTVTYRVVQLEAFQAHLGLGGRFLIDSGNDHSGMNVYFGFDLFPKQPVHLFGSVEVGSLGDATFSRYRGGLGIHVGRAEFYAGYDHMKIGSVNIQGPMLGVRLWF